MANDKKTELLTTYTTDVHALILHGEQAIKRQMDNLKNVTHSEAKAAVAEFARTLAFQRTMIDARIEALGGKPSQPVKDAVSAVVGAAAGVLNAVRASETVKSIRDDYTFFSLLNVSWLMLHTTALSLGDTKTAEVAKTGYGEAAACIMLIDRILPHLVTEELREETTALDVDDDTREMVMNAWNREAAASGSRMDGGQQSSTV